jgi:hypothetical protein
LLVCALGAVACDGSDISRGPLVPSTAVALPPNLDLFGLVQDTAFRPLSGVTVEVIAGPQTGVSMVSDADGRLVLAAATNSANIFRATREGYVPATQAFQRSSPNGSPWLIISMELLTPSVNIAGEYLLTFVADAGCTDLPGEVRTRTFGATITPRPASPVNTAFDVTANGASFLPTFSGFSIGVAGDSLAFWLHGGHDPPLVEQLAMNTYLAYSGFARASVNGSDGPSISAAFEGWIDYCVMPYAMGAVYNCGTSPRTGEPIPGVSIVRAHCESSNHRLVLTRR